MLSSGSCATQCLDVCIKQLIKSAATTPKHSPCGDTTVQGRHLCLIRGQKDENTQRSLSIIEFPLTVRICIKTIIRSNVFQHCFLIIPPPLFLCTVICNFRSPICQALILEIGETVQILEKSEGKIYFA